MIANLCFIGSKIAVRQNNNFTRRPPKRRGQDFISRFDKTLDKCNFSILNVIIS